MHIAINMLDLACFDFRSAAKIWLQRKQRRFNYLPLKLGSKIGLREFLNVLRKYKTKLTKIRTCHLRKFLLDKIFAEK